MNITKITKSNNYLIVTFVLCVLFLSSVTPASATPPVVTLTGKLVNRVCTVQDMLLLQPIDQYRCTLTFMTYADNGTPIYYQVYCPNKPADGQPMNMAYYTCADPGAMQINHPIYNYTVTGWLRTVPQQADGYGMIQGYNFQY
jgi:hypothetical protein